MNNITIILPVYLYSDELKEMFKKAIGSIPVDDDGKALYPVTVVGPKNIIDNYKTSGFESVVDITYLENEKSDFQTQINFAAKECKTPYFSILEIDDQYNKNWFSNVEEHIEKLPTVPFFIPLTEIFSLSSNNPVAVGFANEIALTVAYSDNIGYIGLDELEAFSEFNCTGGVFRVDDFLSIGGLKPSLKIVFWYEFLMRAAKNHKEVYVIPKLGYKHFVHRPGSLMEQISSEVDEDEAKFWFETARQEYHFTEDRKKEYKK